MLYVKINNDNVLIMLMPTTQAKRVRDDDWPGWAFWGCHVVAWACRQAEQCHLREKDTTSGLTKYRFNSTQIAAYVHITLHTR